MREVFQLELQDVQSRLIEISGLVEVSIQNATKAFKEQDVSLAEEVIAGDIEIDELSTNLDELAINILARQQPVARDLRIVVSALRISASLERMGDLAEHVAQLTRIRFPEKVARKTLRKTFNRMGELDVQMAANITELLRTEDLSIADKIRSADETVDELHSQVFDIVLGDAWEGKVEESVDATLTSRYLERFADHAVSIAKKVEYLATGEWSGDTRNAD